MIDQELETVRFWCGVCMSWVTAPHRCPDDARPVADDLLGTLNGDA